MHSCAHLFINSWHISGINPGNPVSLAWYIHSTLQNLDFLFSPPAPEAPFPFTFRWWLCLRVYWGNKSKRWARYPSSSLTTLLYLDPYFISHLYLQMKCLCSLERLFLLVLFQLHHIYTESAPSLAHFSNSLRLLAWCNCESVAPCMGLP